MPWTCSISFFGRLGNNVDKFDSLIQCSPVDRYSLLESNYKFLWHVVFFNFYITAYLESDGHTFFSNHLLPLVNYLARIC